MKVIKLAPEKLEEATQEVLQALRQERVVASPTDTIYGLVADALSSNAVEKVFKIKKREVNKPLPLLVRDLEMAGELALISEDQEGVLNSFWPGKLTAVLKARARSFPRGILSKDHKIGLRVPDQKFLNLLLKKFNSPLTGTSANLSGTGSILKTEEILKQFKDQDYQPDLVVDGGELKESRSSTVVDLTNFKIIREGAVAPEDIYNFQKD